MATVSGADADLAVGAERSRDRLGVAAIGQPGDERARVSCLDLRRAGEVGARGRHVQAAAQPHLGQAGSPEGRANRASRRRRRHAPRRSGAATPAPASVTASTPMASRTGTGDCCRPEKRSPRLRSAAARLAADRLGQAETDRDRSGSPTASPTSSGLLAERQVGVAVKPHRRAPPGRIGTRPSPPPPPRCCRARGR